MACHMGVRVNIHITRIFTYDVVWPAITGVSSDPDKPLQMVVKCHKKEKMKKKVGKVKKEGK